MDKFNFKSIVDKQYTERVKATAPIPEVDAYIFCTSSKYLGENLFPWQSLTIKLYYGLWQKYPITTEEQQVIDTLEKEWHINLNLDDRDPKQLVEILILVMGRRCLHENSKILDPITGERISIKDLYIRRAANVITLNNQFKLQNARATDVYDNGIQDCYKLTTRSGREIKSTNNHPFLTINGWKKLEELSVGDRIAVPSILDVKGKEEISDNEIRLLGFFIGDGSTVKKISFTNINPLIINQFEKDIKELSPDLEIRCWGIDRTVVQPTLTRVIERTIIQKFIEKHGLRGKYSWNKKVPDVIFKSTNRQVALFINSLYACDGWADHKSIGYSTASKELAYDLQHLLLRFGINAVIRIRPTSYKDVAGKKIDCRTAYRLEIITAKDIYTFINQIGILSKEDKLQKLMERKRKDLVYENVQAHSLPKELWENIKEKVKSNGLKISKEFKGKSLYRSGQYAPNRKVVQEFGEKLEDQNLIDLSNSEVYWEAIKSIEYIGKHQTYDLTVPDTHNFVCNDIITHNSGKSALISFIQTFEAYKLICKGDPQKYYKIRSRHPIWLVNTAKDGGQAKDPFRLCKDNIRRIPFFQKYIDWSKDNEEELRIYTPADLFENEQIKKHNLTIPRGSGTQKRNLLEGSIMVTAFTTTAASKRGKAILLLVLDEYAHFDRAKSTSGGTSDEEIISETPQTDYAMLKALQPSTKDFNLIDKNIYDGKVIMISSPREKGGVFYNHYCLAGGYEQANPQRTDINPNYLTLQLSTWHCNPKYSLDSLSAEFKKDPIGSNMEYGAHFGEPSTTFIDSAKIDEMIDTTRHMSYTGNWGYNYIISVDPASKGDTYAVSWGHVEITPGGNMFIIDGIHGFRSQFVTNPVTNKLLKLPVQPAKVVEFIKDLADSLSKQGKILEITFDQWSSVDSITTLKKAGYCAVETFFTNQYKNKIYTDFLEKLNLSAVKIAALPPINSPAGMPPYQFGWLDQTKLELKYLTRVTSGNTVYYEAPTNGPVQTDDFADVCANLIHRHILYQSGDRQVRQELAKQIGHPLKNASSSGFGTIQGNLFKRSGTKIDIRNRIAH